MSEFDMFRLEAEAYKNMSSLRPDPEGNLGKHISFLRWIVIIHRLESFILSFNMD